ncbi:DUF5347 family protein [Arsenophonus apicola]|uniref:DUF5347 family protein n=1 Tax=Arsenophonus apicola TaxID=2879119 RepID=UPI00387A5DB0
MQHDPALSETQYNPMSIKQRAYGLHKINQLKNELFGPEDKALQEFIDNMRDKFNEDASNNKKFLGMILYYAGINKNRHDCKYEEFTKDEIKLIVNAINIIKSGVAMFPKKLPSIF